MTRTHDHRHSHASSTNASTACRRTGQARPNYGITECLRLKQQVLSLEQHVVDLRVQLEERDQDLAAARAANRELMARINTANPNR
jgi:hypothetical protein